MMEDTRQKGFTLIELMVAMAISGMLMAVVAMAYIGQSRSSNAVQDMASLQQDLRASLQLMVREIRMAGYNPDGATGATSPQVLTANATTFQFSLDNNNNANTGASDGDTDDANEIVRYATYTNVDGIDCLGRATGAGVLQPIAENIDQLAYEYLLDNDTWTQTPGDLTQIRSVKIMIMGHSARETAGAVDTTTFTPPLDPSATALDWTPATPGRFHWRMMSLIVQCRNL